MGCSDGNRIQHIRRGYGKGVLIDSRTEPPKAYSYHTDSSVRWLDTLYTGFPAARDTMILSDSPTTAVGTFPRMWGMGAEHSTIFRQVEKDFEKQNSEGS